MTVEEPEKPIPEFPEIDSKMTLPNEELDAPDDVIPNEELDTPDDVIPKFNDDKEEEELREAKASGRMGKEFMFEEEKQEHAFENEMSKLS